MARARWRARVCALRTSRKLGPRLAGLLEMPASSERDRPGELPQVDAGEAGPAPRRRRVGYHDVHCTIDDHSRLAYAEIHPDQTAATCPGLPRNTAVIFTGHGTDRIERIERGDDRQHPGPHPRPYLETSTN